MTVRLNSPGSLPAVRLARYQEIGRPSPRLTLVIADSVALARMIIDRVLCGSL
jgi:hypothetical protein